MNAHVLATTTRTLPPSPPPDAMPTPLLGSDLVALVVLATPVLATVIAEPAHSDAYAIIGAMLGAALGFIKARAHHKNWLDTSYIVLLRSSVGSISPGLLVALLPYIIPTSWQPVLKDMTWHMFAGLGLLFSLYAEQLNRLVPKWLKAKLNPSS